MDLEFPFHQKRDLEDWLQDRDGSSNAFTAPGYVCFHFSCPPDVFGEALERFASLFVQTRIERICRNRAVLIREVRRVDSELDYTSETTQAFYLLKDFINPSHPFSRFGVGNIESLERQPYRAKMDISRALIGLFSKPLFAIQGCSGGSMPDRYCRDGAMGPRLSCKSILSRQPAESQTDKSPFPEAFSSRSKPSQIVLFRAKSESPFAETTERLSIEWPLQLNYTTAEDFVAEKPVISAPTVGFYYFADYCATRPWKSVSVSLETSLDSKGKSRTTENHVPRGCVWISNDEARANPHIGGLCQQIYDSCRSL